MNRIPGNPFTEHLSQVADQGLAVPASPFLEVAATLALAYEQHRTANAAERQATALEARVRIAALTAEKRGHTLPTDLQHLTEGAPE